MSSSAQKNFERKYGNPVRIILESVYLVGLGPAEVRHRNELIFEAYKDVLISLLGRPISEKEIFTGVEEIKNPLGVGSASIYKKVPNSIDRQRPRGNLGSPGGNFELELSQIP